tara:strand:- start:6805 stop:7023 length:219 start_codon:yes stop_codon:yes gene_type:complete
MTEDLQQKELRLRREIAKIRTSNASNDRRVTPNRDFSVGGLPPDTSHKANPASVPDVVLMPAKKRRKTENKW